MDNLRAHVTHTDRGRPQAGRSAHAEEALEALGAVSFGTAMGNGARGLQRWGNGLGILSPRPCPVARVSMGRRRHWRHQRPAPDDLLFGGDVERARPYFEGTAFWADRPRRQSW